jgi:iron complex transport system permease protein
MTSGTLLGWLGLLMQTWFRNPLAGPGVLGITSGGSLGVALAVLLGLALPAWMAAAMGCFAVLLLIGVGARRFVSPVTTLVFGLMISYAVSAVVTVLQSSATAEALQTYVFWGMGTFGKASILQSTSCVALQLLLGMWMMRRAKWLDMWTLGEDLAQTMGVPKARLHLEILLLTGLVLGVVTSVCGPLAFLGLATPHVYRFFHPKRGHMDAIQGIGAWGALLALLADGVVRWTDSLAMHWPLNAVLAILGAPVVLAVLWKRTHDWS